MTDIEVSLMKYDHRPPFFLDDDHFSDVHRMKGSSLSTVEMFTMKSVSGIQRSRIEDYLSRH